jgi:predicted nucleotide-binding protein
VKDVFGEESDEAREIAQWSLAERDQPAWMLDSYAARQSRFIDRVTQAIDLFRTLILRVRSVRADHDGGADVERNLRETDARIGHRQPATGCRVFVVHGHDEAARESVARFLERLNCTVIVLHEMANHGRTIVEKFEAHADVDFAVVLLTADDVGHSVADPSGSKPRARQNVIFELGYFIGRLGRSRVCALHRSDVELPSDMHGVVYVPLDNGDKWKLGLMREMKASGIDIDVNHVI